MEGTLSQVGEKIVNDEEKTHQVREKAATPLGNPVIIPLMKTLGSMPAARTISKPSSQDSGVALTQKSPNGSPKLKTSISPQHMATSSTASSAAATARPFKPKNVLKERFILKDNSGSVPGFKKKQDDEVEETKQDAKEKLSEEERRQLKLCRNKAHAKVLQKKRMHLNVSLTALILKEWQSIYPASKLTGKELVQLYETVCKPEEKKALADAYAAKKRKVSLTPTPEKATGQAADSPTLEQRTDGSVISYNDHADRQWTPAMLTNLHYAHARALSKKSDLEAEWKALYPNSMLSARNLKSRFTVYERTHSGIVAPRCPVKEMDSSSTKSKAIKRSLSASPGPAPTGRPLKKSKSENYSPLKATKSMAVWTSPMINDMFETRSEAVGEHGTDVHTVIARRWHQLWSQRNPSHEYVSKDNLISIYQYHSKKKQNSGESLLKTNGHSKVKETKPKEETVDGDEVVKPPDPEASTQESGLADDSEIKSSLFWNPDKIRMLMKVKENVEERLRCVRDEYFYQILHEKWLEQFPSYEGDIANIKNLVESKQKCIVLENLNGSTKLPVAPPLKEQTESMFVWGELKDEVDNKEDVVNETNNKYERSENVDLIVGEDKREVDLVANETIDDDPTAVPDERADVTEKYVCKERPKEYPNLPRSKWICDYHYIHVFYDDEDKSYECILTDQLLQMRNSLVSKFPGQDIFKSGKKPPGFARLLLHEWKRHYPGSQENNKTISMKIGRYDRAPQMLSQGPISEGGRINWTPNMIEHIRTTRERAEADLGPNAPIADLTVRWQEEWEALYPDLNIDWKQIISRYQYHFGSERRTSVDREQSRSERSTPVRSRVSSVDENTDEIKGFRQWNKSMQEDLIILRDLIYEEHPEIDPGSKEFAQKLLGAFQKRHPSCLETGRSLLAKLKDSLPEQEEEVDRQAAVPVAKKRKSVEVVSPKDIISDIEGFTDWTLGMVRDFISCMDRARRKYTQMKEADPGMKLVPLLLSEWMAMYPESLETVKTFLVRIRHLKTNKEIIKMKLGHHNLLSKMSPDKPVLNEVREEVPGPAPSAEVHLERERFVWDSQVMMPDVISTRAKAIAVQAREQEHGRKVSYSKIWIKEFKKIYPNCPYTGNNLSVHYWYWNNREKGEKKELVASSSSNNKKPSEFWNDVRLAQLSNVADLVRATIDNENTPISVRSRGFAALLHSEWNQLHPSCRDAPSELGQLVVTVCGKKQQSKEKSKAWTPKLNKDLRSLATLLMERGEYTMSSLMEEWRRLHPTRKDKAEHLRTRLDDAYLALPVKDRMVKQCKDEVPAEQSNKENLDADQNASCLNSRGQMRWSQQAVADLLRCHKIAVNTKNKQPELKLATVLHSEFKKRYPLCPVGANVLLTKCYIFRSEIKSGKLVMQDSSEDSSNLVEPLGGSRGWSTEMLKELGPARRRALARKRQLQVKNQTSQLGDLWLEEFKLKFPFYKASKKQLLKKYKFWNSQQNKEATTKSQLSQPVFQEVKSILESTNLILPPHVSDKVIAITEKWVVNSKATGNQPSSLDRFIQLPGGAMLMTKSAGEAEAPKVMETPDISIYPSPGSLPRKVPADGSSSSSDTAPAVDNTAVPSDTEIAEVKTIDQTNPAAKHLSDRVSANIANKPGEKVSHREKETGEKKELPTANIITKLSDIGLPLSSLPAALRVYQETRNIFAGFIGDGYFASWTQLLTHSWTENLLPQNLDTENLESLVGLVIHETKGRVDNTMVSRSSPPLSCTRELVSQVLTVGQDYAKELKAGFSAIRERGIDIAFKEYVSLLSVGGVIKPAKTVDDLNLELELAEVWDQMKLPDRSGEEPGPRSVIRSSAKCRDTNLSMDVVGRWYRRTKNIKVNGVDLLKTVIEGTPGFWTKSKISQLLLAEKRGMRRWNRLSRWNRLRNPLIALIFHEFRKCAGSSVTSAEVMAMLKLLKSQKRSARRKENEALTQLNNEYLDFLESESRVRTMKAGEEKEEEDDTYVADEFAPSPGEAPDFTRDQDVLTYIREKENGRKASCQVWNSTALAVLLRARECAHRRRKEWESWAIKKHGSLQTAYSNPRVKVPKIEDLLMEEWNRLRPNQEGISAWTLNTYIKKFDTLKLELIEEQEILKKRELEKLSPPDIPDCFRGSDIPRFDLEKLQAMEKLPKEVIQLVVTRQRAKTMQEEEKSKLHFLELWREEFTKLEPRYHGSGYQLQLRLFEFYCIPMVRRRLRSAMLMKSPLISEPEPRSAEDYPILLPRLAVFPEVEACDDLTSTVDIRRPVLETNRKIPVISFRTESVNASSSSPGGVLSVPKIWCRSRARPGSTVAYPSKVNILKQFDRCCTDPAAATAAAAGESEDDLFECPECYAAFINFNNYQCHRAMHRNVVVQGPVTESTLSWGGYSDSRQELSHLARVTKLKKEVSATDATAKDCLILVRSLVERAMKIVDGQHVE